MTTDGEKDNRNRDSEFENDIKSRADLLEKCNAGWACLFSALNDFTENNLDKIIYIRNQGHTVWKPSIDNWYIILIVLGKLFS